MRYWGELVEEEEGMSLDVVSVMMGKVCGQDEKMVDGQTAKY